MMFRKDYCDKCNLDGSCSCQKSELMVKNCGKDDE